MKWTDAERAENREALARMTLLQRLEYIFEYYKFPLVLILIAVVALSSVLYYRITYKDTLLYLAYANIAVGDTLDSELGEEFTRSIGADPGKAVVKVYRNLYLSSDPSAQDHQYPYASRLKLMAAMTNRQLDVLLMNQEAYDIMSSGGYLLPLEELLKQDDSLRIRISGQLVTNQVILEDNEIDHQLDESVPYQAVTKTVANAVLISSFDLFEQAEFSGDVYLGVIGNSPRLDTVLQFIDYLTSIR
ncbi:MAG: hypothetical protein IKE25_02985 [Clostridia bacterium]|nr:hypothetical protein [Clostridia bacterium]